MIARLRGTLIERTADTVVVECSGVGYEVKVSSATLAALPEAGPEVTLRVFTHAQENRVALFGFASAEERALFDHLITVKNVGPSTALGILSGGVSARQLAQTIAHGDLAVLTKIRGVGKKTADLLIVELREKCQLLLASWGAGDGGTVAPVAQRRSMRGDVLDDVASALVGMGWRPAEVDKVVARLEVPAGATVELLLRDALRAMPRTMG